MSHYSDQLVLLTDSLHEPAYVRFVGGTRHNQHILVRDRRDLYTLPIYREPAYQKYDFTGVATKTFRVEHYRLQMWCTQFGTLFTEYLFDGEQAKDHEDDEDFWPMYLEVFGYVPVNMVGGAL